MTAAHWTRITVLYNEDGSIAIQDATPSRWPPSIANRCATILREDSTLPRMTVVWTKIRA
jgi:hypothetical protein